MANVKRCRAKSPSPIWANEETKDVLKRTMAYLEIDGRRQDTQAMAVRFLCEFYQKRRR